MGKKSSKTTSKTVYGNTTTTNPYVTSQTNNSGTTTVFNPNTAFNSINKFVNNNMDNLLDEYLNPNLNSVTNQAKLNSYINALKSESPKSLENNIINPLSNRNMIRSSQATDLYKNLSDTTTGSLEAYINQLLEESQDRTASVINNLLKSYMLGYDAISGNASQSLATSAGNSTTSADSTSLMDDGLLTYLLKSKTML